MRLLKPKQMNSNLNKLQHVEAILQVSTIECFCVQKQSEQKKRQSDRIGPGHNSREGAYIGHRPRCNNCHMKAEPPQQDLMAREGFFSYVLIVFNSLYLQIIVVILAKLSSKRCTWSPWKLETRSTFLDEDSFCSSMVQTKPSSFVPLTRPQMPP